MKSLGLWFQQGPWKRGVRMDDKYKLLEQDHRFPSGKWTGFFIQKNPPLGKQWMDLQCMFVQGVITASGNDLVGAFVFKGNYETVSGKCSWNKIYKGGHPVYYEGFNEGKGIWGTWLIEDKEKSINLKGGFHIWPEGMLVPEDEELVAELELPANIGSLKKPALASTRAWLLAGNSNHDWCASIAPLDSEVKGNICKYADGHFREGLCIRSDF
jgi:hypothetical protein